MIHVSKEEKVQELEILIGILVLEDRQFEETNDDNPMILDRKPESPEAMILSFGLFDLGRCGCFEPSREAFWRGNISGSAERNRVVLTCK